MRKALVFFATIAMLSCGRKQEVGEYIYVDTQEVLHVDRECDGICKFETGAAPVSNYPASKVKRGLWSLICSKCVSDATFSEIERQISANIAADEKAKVSAEKLYNRLWDLGECEWTSFESFYEHVLKDKDNMTRLYARLEAKGYDVASLIEESFRPNGLEVLDTLAKRLDSLARRNANDD